MDVDEQVMQIDRAQVALRERPYDLALIPDHEVREYTDPHNEAAVVARWTEVLERLGARVLGVRDVLATPTRLTLDGIEWELSPMQAGKEYRVPPTVFHRIRAAEAAGVRFAWWVWGEEQFAQPLIQPAPAVVEAPKPQPRSRPKPQRSRRLDPLVIGVIPTGPNRGLWVRLGVWFH